MVVRKMQSLKFQPYCEQLEMRLLMSRPVGIDVSNYQPTVNWNTVRNAGYTFAWTKATEGKTFDDLSYSNHISTANAANFLIGAYHYARPDNNSAADEVTHFLAIAGNEVKAGHLLPMLDVENPVDPGDTVNTKAEMSAWVNAWCQGVLNATGVRPIVYTYVSYATSWLDNTVTQWPLWMAHYNGQNPQTGAPSTSPWPAGTWTFWQNNDASGISGVPGDVDVFNGTATQLNSWIIMATPTTPIGPTNNQHIVGSPASLSWTAVANAISYDVYVDNVLKANVATNSWTVTSALGTGNHIWKVVAKNNTGSRTGPNWNFTVDPALSLNAPTNMQVTGATDTTVSISWTDNSSNEQSYLVERKTGAGGLWSQIANLPANSSSFTDVGGAPGTTYFYRVRTSDGGSNFGPYGSEISAMTYASVPTGVTASDGAFTSEVQINWTAAPGASSYQLYRATTNNVGAAALLAPSGTNSYDDVSAVTGTTYYYWVAAKDSLGRSSGLGNSDAGFRAVDSVAPSVLDESFDYTSAAQPVNFRFSEDVSGSLDTSRVTVERLADHAAVSVVGMIYDPATNTASFALQTPLSDGDYRATLSGTGVTDAAGNPIGNDVTLDFFVLTADANHDRAVDTTDFNLLAASFGGTDKSYADGDFNFDSVVDSVDFNLLAGHFGLTLAAPGLGSAPAAAPAAAGRNAAGAFSVVPITNDHILDLLDSSQIH
jgi:GH25 family lysozyme M1 (1,4-beta-N-acetylmuramidase)